MSTDKKSGFHWYTAAWHVGSSARAHTASLSHLSSGGSGNPLNSNTDWYAEGLRLGTSADVGHEDSSLADLSSRLQRAIAYVWQSFRNLLSVSDELRLWQTVDSSGDVLWNAYDPKTNHYVQGLTEQNMRIWIDKRYAR